MSRLPESCQGVPERSLPATAKSLGTTTERLAQMSAEDQLNYVYKYFKPFDGRLNNLGDVYMAMAKSMGEVLDKEGARGQIHVFAQPFPYGFQEVVEDLHLWTHAGVRAEHEAFIDFLNSETGDGGVDLIVSIGVAMRMRQFHSSAVMRS